MRDGVHAKFNSKLVTAIWENKLRLDQIRNYAIVGGILNSVGIALGILNKWAIIMSMRIVPGKYGIRSGFAKHSDCRA